MKKYMNPILIERHTVAYRVTGDAPASLSFMGRRLPGLPDAPAYTWTHSLREARKIAKAFCHAHYINVAIEKYKRANNAALRVTR